MLARIAIMAMTTSNSMSVNPLLSARQPSSRSGGWQLSAPIALPKVKVEYFHRPSVNPLGLMKNKQWMLILLTLVLGAFSIYLNRDWFATDNIQVYHRCRPARFVLGGPPGSPNSESLMFGFDRRLKLTSIKIVPLEALKTNTYAHAVWELVSDSNSVPIKDFTYGMRIRGLRPSQGLTPEPLEPGRALPALGSGGQTETHARFHPPTLVAVAE